MRKIRAQRIKEMREMLGMSQQDLADKTGISLRQVARYEAGSSDITGDPLELIAKGLECSIDYLMGVVDHPNQILKEADLSPDEWLLLKAYRNGEIKRILWLLSAAEDFIPDVK